MAKTRKKARKAAKRKSATKAKPRKTVRKKSRKTKSRKAKARKQTSLIDMMRGAASEARALRGRLAGHNTFED